MKARKILRQYLFSLVVILCVGLLFLGVISARERTRYNMDMTMYATVEIDKDEKGDVVFRYGEKTYTVKSDYIERIRNAGNEGVIFDFRQIFA